MAGSINQPRPFGDIPTYVVPAHTSPSGVQTSTTSSSHSPFGESPSGTLVLGTSPTNSGSSSLSTKACCLQSAQRRGSYSCVKEDDCGTAQSFVESKLSSVQIASATESPSSQPEAQIYGSAVPSGMQAPTICCSCGGLQGWQYTQTVGKRRTKSYIDLRLLAVGRGGDELQDLEWAKRPKLRESIPARIQEPSVHAPGESPLEQLPTEIL
ncbi:MAG: hypothetical protein M1830_010842, partial [Pleopsidium flavum]